MRLFFRYIIIPLALLVLLLPAVAQSNGAGAGGVKQNPASGNEAALRSEDRVLPQNAPRVSGKIEPDSIGIGDRFFYTIDIEKDQVQGVFFPEFGGEGSSHYELIESLPVDTLERDGRRLKLRKRYELAAFQEGCATGDVYGQEHCRYACRRGYPRLDGHHLPDRLHLTLDLRSEASDGSALQVWRDLGLPCVGLCGFVASYSVDLCRWSHLGSLW